MNWTATEDIVRDLKLEASPRDYDALKRELRTRLATLHPDKNGGVFPDKGIEEMYNSVSSAYEFVTHASDDSRALIPVSQLPAIIKAVREAQVAPAQLQISALRAEFRIESRMGTHDRYIFPKIGSGVFAAVCAFLFTFSGSLAGHPILGPLSKNSEMQYGLLAAASLAGIFFVLTWVRERKQEAKEEWLISEQGRRKIFNELLNQASDPMDSERDGRFTGREVVTLIQRESYESFSMPFLFLTPFRLLGMFTRPCLSLALAEKITEVHLLELEKRGAISRVEGPSIDTVYQIDERIFKQSQNRMRH